LVQGATVLARGVSTAGTGGLANPLLATIELGGSALISIGAIVAPFIALGLVAVLLLVVFKKAFRKDRGASTRAGSLPQTS
jgi:hypothetical protein